MPLLDVRDLAIEFSTPSGSLRAVDGADFTLDQGAVLGLVGESGCGKTTLGRSLIGVMAGNARVARGSILFNGVDLVAASEGQRRQKRWRDIAFIPQSAMNALDPVYRMSEQFDQILRGRGGQSRRAAQARAEALFDMIGIDPARLRDYPHQFSGGMRQRVAIAMALALEPRLIVADEPVTALDVIVQRQVLDVLTDLRARLGVSIILITHDISVVAYACDQVAVMYAGKVVESGPVRGVLKAPAHPYTMGLSHAFPDMHGPMEELVPIEGNPPDLHHPPVGCRFRPRCPFAIEMCETQPALALVETHHAAACWRQEERAQLRDDAGKVSTWRR